MGDNKVNENMVVRTDGFLLTGQVGNSHINWLVAAGCMITTIYLKISHQTKEEEKPELFPYAKNTFFFFSG